MKKVLLILFFVILFCTANLLSYTQPPPYWGESLYPIVNWSDIVFIDSQNNEIYCSKNKGEVILPEKGIVKMKFKLKNYDKFLTWSGVIKIRIDQIRKCEKQDGEQFIYNQNVTFIPNEIKEFSVDINCSELIEFSKYDSTVHLTLFGTDEPNIEGQWQIAAPPFDERVKWKLPQDFWSTPLRVFFGQTHFDNVEKSRKGRKNPRNINLKDKQNTPNELFPYYHQTANINDSRSYYIKPIWINDKMMNSTIGYCGPLFKSLSLS